MVGRWFRCGCRRSDTSSNELVERSGCGLGGDHDLPGGAADQDARQVGGEPALGEEPDRAGPQHLTDAGGVVIRREHGNPSPRRGGAQRADACHSTVRHPQVHQGDGRVVLFHQSRGLFAVRRDAHHTQACVVRKEREQRFSDNRLVVGYDDGYGGRHRDDADTCNASAAGADEPVMTIEDALSVVLVDDHALFSQSLSLVLESYPDIVIKGRADTLAGGVSLVARHQPDVVLMDYRLPDGDGVAGAHRVKEVSAQTKVVILTAIEDEAVLAAAIEAGCAGFITKTSSVDDLVAAVRQAAAGEAVITPSLLVRLLPRLHRREQPTRFDLTPRELEVLKLLATGLSNAAIAEELSLSVNTVRNHVANLLMKLGVHSKLEALSVAVREGLVAPR